MLRNQSCVAVYDIQIVYLVEMMLCRIGCIYAGNPRIETTSQDMTDGNLLGSPNGSLGKRRFSSLAPFVGILGNDVMGSYGRNVNQTAGRAGSMAGSVAGAAAGNVVGRVGKLLK